MFKQDGVPKKDLLGGGLSLPLHKDLAILPRRVHHFSQFSCSFG